MGYAKTETVLVWAQADYDPKTEDYVVPAKPDYQEGRVFANVREDSVIYFALAEKNTQGAITVYENVRPATSGAITVHSALSGTKIEEPLKQYEKNAKEGLYTLYSEVSGDCYVTCKDTSVKNLVELAFGVPLYGAFSDSKVSDKSYNPMGLSYYNEGSEKGIFYFSFVPEEFCDAETNEKWSYALAENLDEHNFKESTSPKMYLDPILEIEPGEDPVSVPMDDKYGTIDSNKTTSTYTRVDGETYTYNSYKITMKDWPYFTIRIPLVETHFSKDENGNKVIIKQDKVQCCLQPRAEKDGLVVSNWISWDKGDPELIPDADFEKAIWETQWEAPTLYFGVRNAAGEVTPVKGVDELSYDSSEVKIVKDGANDGMFRVTFLTDGYPKITYKGDGSSVRGYIRKGESGLVAAWPDWDDKGPFLPKYPEYEKEVWLAPKRTNTLYFENRGENGTTPYTQNFTIYSVAEDDKTLYPTSDGTIVKHEENGEVLDGFMMWSSNRVHSGSTVFTVVILMLPSG